MLFISFFVCLYFLFFSPTQGEYEKAVIDCDSALELCKENHRALYTKALCLKELGKYKEAYYCTTDCLLLNRLVRHRTQVSN